MRQLLNAVFDAVRPNLPKIQFYHGDSPIGAVMPFCVYNVKPSMPAEYATADGDGDQHIIEDYNIQFAVYHTDADAVAGYLEDIRNQFEDNTITLPTGKTLMALYKGGESLDPDPDRTQAGRIVWQGILILESKVYKEV